MNSPGRRFFRKKVNHEKYPDVTQENKFELQNILSKRHG